MINRVIHIATLALSVLFLSMSVLKAQSDVIWSQTYGGEQDESFKDIVVNKDGVARVVGFGQSNIGTIKTGRGLYDIIVCEMSADGELNWSNTIGGSNNDLGKSILIDQNENTFIGGLTYSEDFDEKQSQGGGDIIYGSIDEAGALNRSTLFGGNKLDNIVGIKQQLDGSIILVANTNSTDISQSGITGGTDIFICRLLPDGVILWDNTLGSNGVDKASDFTINSNGEIIIVGTTFSDEFLGYKKGIKDGFALCLNSEGVQVWGSRFSNGNYSSIVACDLDENDNIYMTGIQGRISASNSGINGVYNEDIWVIKIDEDGNEKWRNLYGGSDNDYATDIVASLDGGLLVVGNTVSYDGIINGNYGNKDAFALKLDASGNRVWSEKYGGSEDDVIEAAAQDKYGHYWLTGQTISSDNDLSENNGGSDAWIIKLEGELPALQFELGEDIEICKGESIELNVELDFCDCSYSWSDGEEGAQRTISPTENITLELTVSDEEGNSAIDEIDIIVNSLPQLELDVRNPFCADSENGMVNVVAIDTNNPLSYDWNTGANTENISNLSAGEYMLTVSDANGCTNSFSTEIIAPEPISINSISNTATCNTNTGSITVEVDGGTGHFTYNWDNGNTESTNEELLPGEYTVTITDANECFVVEEYLIDNVDIDFELEFEVINNSCFADASGEIQILNAEGLANLEWNTGAEDPTISELAAGEYSLNYTTNLGCTGEASFEITEPRLLEATANTNNNLCFDDNDGSIALELRGGTQPYSYEWNTGEDTPFIKDLVAGSYSVIISDANGCSIEIEEEITAPSPIEILDSQIKDESCVNALNGTITIEAVGGTGALDYAWSNGESNQNIANLAAGTYEVTITDTNNCTLITELEVADAEDFPNVAIQKNNPACFGDANGIVMLSNENPTVNSLSYQWPDGETNSIRDDLAAGNYEVIISTQIGCSIIEEIIIEDPEELTIEIDATDITCFDAGDAQLAFSIQGGTMPYQVNHGNMLSLDLSGNEGVIGNLTAGTYGIEVVDYNGCTLESSASISEPELIVVQGIVKNISCFGEKDGFIETVVSGGVGEFNYNWSNDAVTNRLDEIAAGTYTVIVTDENACSQERTFDVSQPDELLVNHEFTQPSSSNDDGTINVNIEGGISPYEVIWQHGATGTSLTDLTSGIYTYTIFDKNECTYTDFVVLEAPNSTSLLAPFDGVSVFPNPIDQQLNISTNDSYQDVQIFLLNSLGQSVYSEFVPRLTSHNKSISAAHLPAGVYYLHLVNQEYQSTYKLVVSRH